MMTLAAKQRLFPSLVAKLINHIYENGYEVTFGECWRSPETAAAMAKAGKGISTSLHISRLAIDLNLFKDGVWKKNSEDHKAFGDYWKSLSTKEYECAWGGDFKSNPDGNHYSVAEGGRK